MNILYHHRTRGTSAEGAHIRGVVNALRGMGHNVDILSFPGVDPEGADVPKTEGQEQEPKKSIVKSIIKKASLLTKNTPEFIFELLEFLYNGVAYFRLNKMVKNQATDLIYERYSLFMFVGVWLANKKSIPIILEVNDSAIVHRVRPLMFKKIAKKFEQWTFSHCTGIVFISSHFRDLVQQEYGLTMKTVVTPNAADLSVFDFEKYDKERLKEELNLSGKIVCGYVGSFTHWHGVDWFIDTIAPRLKENPLLVLLLVGDGVSYEFIENVAKQQKIEDQLILTGMVTHDAVPKYIAAMDFGILPDSNTYGSPMKLFEFMAMNCGMVVPDFSPIQEVVDDKKNSWIFPKKDQQACVNLVMEISKDKDEIVRVGDYARKYIKTERQWKHNAELMLTLIE